MCILFLFVNNNATDDGFQMIVAMNRDEFLNRPTAPAQFWNGGSCISGLDMEPGREGGTWFGASITGKIGALLNISGQTSLQRKLGRGHLVTDFLTMNMTASEFAAKVSSEEENYDGFNLVLLEKRNEQWTVNYVSNGTNNISTSSILDLPTDGVLAWGNSTHEKPWRKVSEGRLRFAEIVRDATTATRDELIKQLFIFLDDKTSHLPDVQLESTSSLKDPVVLAARSAIFVDLAALSKYGTRTQTVLLIDVHGNCDFIERTMKEPIDYLCPVWETTTHAYSLANSF